jgi:hypothetical protein
MDRLTMAFWRVGSGHARNHAERRERFGAGERRTQQSILVQTVGGLMAAERAAHNARIQRPPRTTDIELGDALW